MREVATQKSLDLPKVIFGTSGLGNLFVALDEETKLEIIRQCVLLSEGKVVFDSAGKYGAGLALEVLGRHLSKLNIQPHQVMISNKLGWVRCELRTPEPTFEPGVWRDLQFDAVQKISYDGIIECFEQGNTLLNGYIPQMVSVHDPDEYLAAAGDASDAGKRYQDILDAYKALFELKQKGQVQAVGVGAKDWHIIHRIAQDVTLDWVMFANSMTIKRHPQQLFAFISELHKKGVTIINSAVFHSGFLVGTDYFDYKLIQRGTPENDRLFDWRDTFFAICNEFGVKPAVACVQFALNVPGVTSIALNTTSAHRIKENIEMANAVIPADFWKALDKKGLIN
jgi:D-threo-aldose 1-dehydrogenase